MDLKSINSTDETTRLKKINFLFGRNFLVTIADENDNVLFYPSMISNFSIDGSKIFISLYDFITEDNVEEKLDKLSGNFFKKPTMKILLSRLDYNGDEVYKVIYSKCKLNAYHGTNFAYKSNYPYQWYLEVKYGSKEIVKSENYNFKSSNNIDVNGLELKKAPKITKEQSVAILKNSNKMLDEAIEAVSATKKLNDKQKENIAREIVKAKVENVKNAHKYYGASLDSIDFTSIAKNLKEAIDETENKLDNYSDGK